MTFRCSSYIKLTTFKPKVHLLLKPFEIAIILHQFVVEYSLKYLVRYAFIFIEIASLVEPFLGVLEWEEASGVSALPT